MADYISKSKWAWRAQFEKQCIFDDKQMILLSLFDILTGFRFQKNLKSLPIQVLRHPFLDIQSIKNILKEQA